MGTRCSIPRLLCPGISTQNQGPPAQTIGHNPNGTTYKDPITHRLRFGHLGTRCESLTAKGRDLSFRLFR